MRDVDVAELLAEFGQSATLTQWAKGSYSVSGATVGSGTETDYTVTVAVVDFTDEEIDGSLVLRTDKKVFMGGAEQTPTLNDRLTIGGVTHELISVKTTSPGGVVVLYQLQVRK